MRISYIIALAAVLAGALSIVIYWTGLHGGFFFDDGASILLAEGVRIESMSVESLRQAIQSGYAGPSGRPIAQLSFALNYYFSNFSPFAFKATNLAIHFSCGLLVFFLALRLLAAAMPQAKPQHVLLTAGWVAVLWLLHPIQLLPVLHVVQRMTSLSAFFLLAALLLHIHGRECGGRKGVLWLAIAWGGMWPLSFFSKETGALFPMFVLAWETILGRNAYNNLDRFARIYAVLFILFLAAGVAYLLSPLAQWVWAGYELRPFSLTERLLTESRVLWFYLGLILYPRLEVLGLYHDDIVISSGLLSPWTTLPALAGLVGLVMFAWRLRARTPLVSFGLAWFLIGHAMESTVLPLEIAHEHRNYLPLLGILLMAAWGLNRVLEFAGMRKTIGVGLAIAAIIYFPLVTALRSQQFGDDGRRTQIEAQHHQQSARAQQEAGSYLAGLKESASPDSQIHALAREHFARATILDPHFKPALLGLIYLNCKAGRQVERTELNELSRRLKETPFAPADRNVLFNLKNMSLDDMFCLSSSDIQMLFSAAFSNRTVSITVLAMLHSWHADYLMLRENDLSGAKRALSKSLQLVPENSSNQLKWAQLVLLEGRKDEAIQLLKALRNEMLTGSEKKTVVRLLACLQGDISQCGNM